MEEKCECGGVLEKSTTNFKGKKVPCWKCTKCGKEFFDMEQAEILDKYITNLMNQRREEEPPDES